MTEPERDYYETLGVPRDADKKTIKDAYHRLAMKWHPDRNKSPEAEDRFKEIAKAYAILSDPEKRARYDARGFEGVAHYSYDDLFGDLDLESLFGDLGFGFGPGDDSIFDRIFGGGRREPLRGADLRVSLRVPLETIARGGTETVRFSRTAKCPACGGYGTSDGRPPSACPDCGGSGHKVVRREQGREEGHSVQIQQIVTCPRCGGRGTLIGESCPRCGGAGQMEQPETIKLHIPAGFEDGMALRVAGHGLPGGEPGAEAGDLLVMVHSAPDPRFQRRGANLWRSEQLRLDEAVLGAKRLVPTLDGDVEVTIPAGSQPDSVLRLRGKGLPRYHGQGHGDLILRLQVQIPTRLSDEERRLFDRLRRLRERQSR